MTEPKPTGAETTKPEAKSPLKTLLEKQRISFKDQADIIKLIAAMDTNDDVQAMSEVSDWVKKQMDVVAEKIKPYKTALDTGKNGLTGADLEDEERIQLQEHVDDHTVLNTALIELAKVAAERIAEIKSGEPITPADVWAGIKSALVNNNDAEGIAVIARMMNQLKTEAVAAAGQQTKSEDQEDTKPLTEKEKKAKEKADKEEALKEALELVQENMPEGRAEAAWVRILLGTAQSRIPIRREFARSRILARAEEIKAEKVREEENKKYEELRNELREGGILGDLNDLSKFADKEGHVDLGTDSKLNYDQRTAVLSQLLFMAEELGMINVPAEIEESKKKRLREKFGALKDYAELNKENEALVRAYFESRLDAVKKAFPKVATDYVATESTEPAKKKKDDEDSDADKKSGGNEKKDEKRVDKVDVAKVAKELGVTEQQINDLKGTNLLQVYDGDAIRGLITKGTYNLAEANDRRAIYAALDMALQGDKDDAQVQEAAQLLLELSRKAKKA